MNPANIFNFELWILILLAELSRINVPHLVDLIVDLRPAASYIIQRVKVEKSGTI